MRSGERQCLSRSCARDLNHESQGQYDMIRVAFLFLFVLLASPAVLRIAIIVEHSDYDIVNGVAVEEEAERSSAHRCVFR